MSIIPQNFKGTSKVLFSEFAYFIQLSWKKVIQKYKKKGKTILVISAAISLMGKNKT